MKKPTDTAIIESLLRVYEKSDDESWSALQLLDKELMIVRHFLYG